MARLSSTNIYGDLTVSGGVRAKGTPGIASLTTTNSSLNINQSSWVKIPWNNQKIVDRHYTHSEGTNPEEITFTEDGTYMVYCSLAFNSPNGDIRVNPGIKFAINGNRRDAIGMSGYIRHGSGHDRASNSIMETIEVSRGDTLTVQTIQKGSSGTVNMLSNKSTLEIYSRSVTGYETTNADTVDGRHASEFLLDSGGTLSGKLSVNSDIDLSGTINENTSI